MKRLALSLILLLAFVMSAYAECQIVPTIVFTDYEHLLMFYRIASVAGVDSPQCQKLIIKLGEEGVMILINKNTSVENVEKVNDNVSWVTINGTRVLVAKEALTCK